MPQANDAHTIAKSPRHNARNGSISYASDGRCHNANNGTFGHECGKPATWISTAANGFQSGYCDDCKRHGDEAQRCIDWRPLTSVRRIVNPGRMNWEILPAFQAADDAWSRELVKTFGKDAGQARYEPRGKGEPGTPLHATHAERSRLQLLVWGG